MCSVYLYENWIILVVFLYLYDYHNKVFLSIINVRLEIYLFVFADGGPVSVIPITLHVV